MTILAFAACHERALKFCVVVLTFVTLVSQVISGGPLPVGLMYAGLVLCLTMAIVKERQLVKRG
jgi:hypothetical protein